MVVRLLDGGTSGNTAHRTLLRTQRTIRTLVAQSRGRRPKPTPIPSRGTQKRLLLLHAFLAGVIPYLAGFLAVLFGSRRPPHRDRTDCRGWLRCLDDGTVDMRTPPNRRGCTGAAWRPQRGGIIRQISQAQKGRRPKPTPAIVN